MFYHHTLIRISQGSLEKFSCQSCFLLLGGFNLILFSVILETTCSRPMNVNYNLNKARRQRKKALASNHRLKGKII